MDKMIFALCGFTALWSAYLLMKGYLKNKSRLLLWSAICFAALSLSNFLIIVDRWIFPDIDLSFLRLFITLIGMLFLIYGLIWESE
ncbi:MAG TPA: DUF5985 family protein [Candidatus Eisenbacteria bacterium]|jgi:hypothetical protein|nr:DUF5985 family protein [Candidatus Eisenbacteria bacterium]